MDSAFIILNLIDGHHKLIRWRFVTHAGIDGYSPLTTFIRCSTNNKAEMMYNTFMEGVQRFGLPSRVRTDQGRENIQVACHMLCHRGCSHSSVLVGSSVHNQRIERFYGEIYTSVLPPFTIDCSITWNTADC